jgi:hypothetical protein
VAIAKGKACGVAAYRLNFNKRNIGRYRRIIQEFFACMFIDTQGTRTSQAESADIACTTATVVPFEPQLSFGSSKNFLRLNH